MAVPLAHPEDARVVATYEPPAVVEEARLTQITGVVNPSDD
jgi:hypothetical protein